MTTTAWLWLAALGPLALMGAAFDRRTALRVRGAATLAAAFALAVSLVGLAALVARGPLRTPSLSLAGIGFGLQLDAVSAPMFVLVAFIGLVVTAYSRHYLDGDPQQAAFVRKLAATIASVLFFVLAGNLFQAALAWFAASLTLHGLLIFRRERRPAVLAARKKFLVSRLGDALLAAAMALIYAEAHTLDYAALFDFLRAEPPRPALQAAAVLAALAALVKSAQFPLQGWLLEVTETPTPVSALLHAGVINAGGFLMLRLSPLVAASPAALHILAVVGAATAILGALAMLTQTSVKVSLAYSTIAQMGFMMLECGLGVFSAALLHLLAHSLYKAHAFLTSGSVIDIARAAWTPKLGIAPHPARTLLATLAAVAIAAGAGLALGERIERPGVLALGIILALGLVPLIANAIDERPDARVLARTGLAALGVAVAYFGLQRGAATLLAPALAPPPDMGALGLGIAVAIVAAFALLTLFQALSPSLSSREWARALYVHAANGFYVNTLANRALLAVWPAASARTGVSS